MIPDLSFADPRYFERLYAHDPDPWRFKTSDYEREKYAATLDALPPGRYERGFEVGCSIGVLTRQLAASCDTLLAADISRTAIRHAEQLCDDLPWVQFAAMDIRREWPEGSFDLILFSEVLYYLSPDEIAAASANSLSSLAPAGAVLLVNWLGPTGAACTGDEAADHFIAAARPRLVPILQRRTESYRIDALK